MRSAYLALTAAALLGSGAVWQQMHSDTPLNPHVRSLDRHATDAAASRAAHTSAEAERLRAHFDMVDSELRTRDVSALTAEQRGRRAQLIQWLSEYSDRGVFPLNDGYADGAVPIFRDADGTLCAMAYLIDRSGHGDIVDRIAQSRNTAYVRELVDDPELVAWLEEYGLSADEAGRIQPAYGPLPAEADPDFVSAEYALASLALTGTSLVTSYANVTGATRLSGILGLVAGSATAVTGVLRLDEHGGVKQIAVANTAVGALAIGAAMYGLHSLRGDGGQASAGAIRVGGAELTAVPDIISVADRSRLGIVLQARF